MSATPRMTGGELQGDAHDRATRLRTLILLEPDVHSLIALEQIETGEWAYFIETPFATFPRFVVGLTDETNTAPQILAKSSAEWSCRGTFYSLTYK